MSQPRARRHSVWVYLKRCNERSGSGDERCQHLMARFVQWVSPSVGIGSVARSLGRTGGRRGTARAALRVPFPTFRKEYRPAIPDLVESRSPSGRLYHPIQSYSLGNRGRAAFPSVVWSNQPAKLGQSRLDTLQPGLGFAAAFRPMLAWQRHSHPKSSDARRLHLVHRALRYSSWIGCEGLAHARKLVSGD
jgi:hypothetical protein